jgi:hypothetical protein
MRALFLAILGAAALWVTPPAEASQWNFHGPFFGVGYGFYPHSYYSPWYGPRFGVGIHVGQRSPARRARTTERREGTLKLYVYPAAGQSEAQTAEDRYQCHVWAADQSGHDPTLGTGSRDEAESYTRAFSACMEGRSYVVK